MTKEELLKQLSKITNTLLCLDDDIFIFKVSEDKRVRDIAENSIKELDSVLSKIEKLRRIVKSL